MKHKCTLYVFTADANTILCNLLVILRVTENREDGYQGWKRVG